MTKNLHQLKLVEANTACREMAKRVNVGREQLERHLTAWTALNPSAVPVAMMVKALAAYADNHFERYGSRLGEDQVLGEAWSHMVRECRELLNGELNGLDGGTLDKMLLGMLELERQEES